eukprot:SAG11_NODE_15731_length_568_cov_0.569296_1_plen_94_part_10
MSAGSALVIEITRGIDLPALDGFAFSKTSDPYCVARLHVEGAGPIGGWRCQMSDISSRCDLDVCTPTGAARQSLTKLTDVNPVWRFYADFAVSA